MGLCHVEVTNFLPCCHQNMRHIASQKSTVTCSCAPFALLFKIVACISNILQTWPCTATPEQGLDTRTGVQSFVTIALGLSKLPDLHEMHAIIYPDISAGQYK